MYIYPYHTCVDYSSFLRRWETSRFRSVGKVHDEWFADEERVRNTVGILERPVVPPSDDTEVFSLNYRIWFGFLHFSFLIIHVLLTHDVLFSLHVESVLIRTLLRKLLRFLVDILSALRAGQVRCSFFFLFLFLISILKNSYISNLNCFPVFIRVRFSWFDVAQSDC